MKLIEELLQCPQCNKNLLRFSQECISCFKCKNDFQIKNNTPLMFLPNNWKKSINDVSKIVKKFYEKTPFPNYESIENKYDLILKAEKSFYAKILNEQTPFNSKVLEVGCGTGQLSNYLGIANRYVFGVDMCLNSLKLAENFRKENNICNTSFIQMNLFNPVFKKASFDLVICQGVLHHTSNPYLGFQKISQLVKKNGYIIIGLYNKYGRILTDIRRLIFKFTGDNFKFIDPRLRKIDRGKLKRESWFNDQYKHPHESKHTIGEVINWLELNNFDFINSIPKPTPLNLLTINEKLFKKNKKGTMIDNLIVQIFSIFTGYKEGGLFLIIGKKR